MEDPWGRDEPPASGRLDEMVAQGWSPPGPDNFWSLLPAAWPADYRCWLPVPSQERRGRPWLPGADEAAAAGLPAPPDGRRWLLRSPVPWLSLSSLVFLIQWRTAQTAGERNEFEPTYVFEAAGELLAWDDAALTSWLQTVDRNVAGQWRAAGRVGDDVTGLVLAGLGPDDVAALSALGVDEAAALLWHESTFRRGPELAEAVRLWHGRGVLTPPPGLFQLNSTSEVEGWLAAGFSLDDVLAHPDLPLERATTWRDAGMTLVETAAWFAADGQLTVAEATAYEVPNAYEWAARGFDAAEAAAWTAVGIDPDRARVWRAARLCPLDVHDDRLPPGARTGGWIGVPPDHDDFVPHVLDPPGTRGRRGRSSGA